MLILLHRKYISQTIKSKEQGDFYKVRCETNKSVRLATKAMSPAKEFTFPKLAMI